MTDAEKKILNKINNIGLVCIKDKDNDYEAMLSLCGNDIIEPLSNYYGHENDNAYWYILKGNPFKVKWIYEGYSRYVKRDLTNDY